MKIKSKLTLILLAITFGATITIGIFSYWNARDRIIEQTVERMEIAADFKAKNVFDFFHMMRSQLETAQDYYNFKTNHPTVERLIEDRENADYVNAVDMLDSQVLTLVESNQHIDRVLLASLDEKIVYTTDVGERKQILGTKLGQNYSQAFEEGQIEVYFSEIFQDMEKDNEIELPIYRILATAPLYSHRGQLIGVIIFDVNAEAIYTLIQKQIGSYGTAETLLGRDEGDHALFLHNLKFDQHAAFTKKLSYDQNNYIPMPEATQGRSGSGLAVDYRLEPIIAAWRSIRIGHKKWGLVTKVDRKEAFMPIIEFRNFMLVISLILSTFVLLIASYMASRISNPIIQIDKIAKFISEGGLDIAIDPQLKKGKDEISGLANSFEMMRLRLNDSYRGLEEKVRMRTKVLEESEIKTRTIVESTPNGLVMIDGEGKIVLANSQIEKYFGYTQNDLMGQNIEVLLPKHLHEKHYGYRNEYLKKPEPRSMGAGRDLFGVRKDGSEIPVEIGLSPIILDNETFVLATIIDITERKKSQQVILEKTEELERSNKELEQFAYVASHDLQEPIRKIVGFTQLFETSIDAKIEGKSRDYMDYVIDGAKRMQTLIQDLLQYSRAGSADLTFEDVDFNLVIEEVKSNLELVIKESDAQITYTKLPTLRAHKTFISRLFQNLVGNALKYRSKEVPKITIAARQNSKFWEFTVSDNGIGIDPIYAERIFVIFQRLHGKDQYEGTGIGLSVCRRMVERHGGQMWLDQPINEKGSTFKFTLPIRKS